MGLLDTSTQKQIAAITAIVTSVVAMIAAVFFVDQRYAHAQELSQVRQQAATDISQVRTEQQGYIKQLQIENRMLRRSLIEDKVFELEQAPRKTPAQDAQLNRYQRQIDDINSEIRDLKTTK